MKMRMAFASTDGAYIDQHFGSARFFQIFDVSDSQYVLTETRRTASLCQGNCEGGFEHLLKTLQDCDAIFTLKIGQGAAAYMISHGKRVFEASGPVEDVIEQVLEGDFLDER